MNIQTMDFLLIWKSDGLQSQDRRFSLKGRNFIFLFAFFHDQICLGSIFFILLYTTTLITFTGAALMHAVHWTCYTDKPKLYKGFCANF